MNCNGDHTVQSQLSQGKPCPNGYLEYQEEDMGEMRADIAALVELVGQLPKSHETINVSTVSKHCPENMLVFRSLFGLSQKAIPKRAVFHAIHRPSVWQSVHIVKEPKSILGGNYVNWLRSGPQPYGRDHPKLMSCTKRHNDAIHEAFGEPDIIICSVPLYREREDREEEVILEIPYLYHPEAFAKRGIVLLSGSHNFRRLGGKSESVEDWGRRFNSKVDDRSNKMKRAIVENVFSGATHARSLWRTMLFGSKAYETVGVKYFASSEEDLLPNNERWISEVWLTILQTLPDCKLRPFFEMTKAQYGLTPTQVETASRHFEKVLERLTKTAA